MKTFVDKLWSFFKTQWLMIWIVVAALTLSALAVSADFLNSNTNMKRVVVATALNGKMFSSDWLYENGISNKSRRSLHFEQLTADAILSGSTYNVPIHIYNFDADNPKKHYDQDITYNLEAKLVHANGTDVSSEEMGDKTVTIEYRWIETVEVEGVSSQVEHVESTILKNDKLSDTTSFTNQTLIAEENPLTSSQRKYTLKFSGNWDLEADSDIYVQLHAVRTGDSAGYSDITNLGGMIGITKSNSGTVAGWNGVLNESGTPSDYDGYNFVLTGSGGAAIILGWDTEKVAVNKYFYYHHEDENNPENNVDLRNIEFDDGEVVYTPADNTTTWAKIEISADSNVRNRYEFQLYKVGTTEPPADFVSISTNGPATKTDKWAACTISNSAS